MRAIEEMMWGKHTGLSDQSLALKLSSRFSNCFGECWRMSWVGEGRQMLVTALCPRTFALADTSA